MMCQGRDDVTDHMCLLIKYQLYRKVLGKRTTAAPLRLCVGR